MIILLAQDGYENKVFELCESKADVTYCVYKNRRNIIYYFYFLFSIFFKILFSKVFNVDIFLYYSTHEKCEYLLWFLIFSKIFKKQLVFKRMKINDREASFIFKRNDSFPFSLRLRFLSRVFPSFFDVIINDIGQCSWSLSVSHEVIEFPKVKLGNSSLRDVKRIIILAEPIRSSKFFDIFACNDKISDLVKVIKSCSQYSIDASKVFVKEHPNERCIIPQGFEFEILEKRSNIFDFIASDDVVVGTFGSVMDICPSICLTISVLSIKNISDENIVKRVIDSGVEIFEYNNYC